jgi:hypothetical protein
MDLGQLQWYNLVRAASVKFTITEFTIDLLLNLKSNFTGVLKKLVTNKNPALPPSKALLTL